MLKIRQRESDLSKEVSRVLSKAVALSGSSFPNPEQSYLLTTARSQAAILIGQLLHNLEDSTDRLETAREILEIATPITFKFDCFRWMRSPKDTPDEERTFSIKVEEDFGKFVAESAKNESKTKNLYKEYGSDAKFLLWIWSHYLDQDELEKYLVDSFDEDEKNVINFLLCYLPTSWDMGTGIPRTSDFERDQFNAVTEIIDPKIIIEKLEKIFGDSLKAAKDTYLKYEDVISRKVAYQFTYLYHFVQNEKNKTASQPETDK